MATGIEISDHATMVVGCAFHMCYVAIEAYNTPGSTIMNCYMGACGRHFLLVEDCGFGLNFVHNRCEQAGREAIRISGCDPESRMKGITIRDNHFDGLNTAAQDGIYLEYVEGVLIERNFFQAELPGAGAHTVVFGPGVSDVSLAGNFVLPGRVDPRMSGYQDVPLQIDDVTASQSSASGGFGGDVGIGGRLSITDIVTLEPRDSPPSPASEGDMYMDAIQHKLMVFDGTTWNACW
jgi:hypothetical protein